MDKKILLVGWGYPPDIDGGLDIHVKHLFEELERKEVDVELALPEERAPDRENIIAVETGGGDMVQRARKMSQELVGKAGEFDIIHTHDWLGSETGFKAKKYSGTKWVSTFHSLSSKRNRKPDKRLEKMEKAGLEKPDKVLSVSERLRDQIKEEYNIDSEVVYNGFSTPPSSGKDVKEELGIEGKMVFYVGRHAEQKGIEHLLYGFSKLDEEAELVIGGEGHMKDSLEQFTEILGVGDRVIFTGFIPREELGDYYREADAFVSPSIDEPFGLTITEALESGTPVVATSNGVEEIAGGSIISVDPGSDSIREGISEALKMDKPPNYRNRSWSEMAEEVIDIYSELS